MNCNFKMHRIVHFDLKGAPPRLVYFKQVLHCIKSWGATGVLLEWEDTFPYSGSLKHLGSLNNMGGDDLYDMCTVQCIFTLCKEMDLEVIQLVQTIGHLEFVLKHPSYEHLREYGRSHSNICPEKQGSRELVQQMVMQVLGAQPDAKYIHIGADEVFHMGICEDCRVKATHFGHCRLYLDYIQNLVMFIKERSPHITILMWDDMIRAMNQEALEVYRELCNNVQLVVWNYETQDRFSFPPNTWANYKKYFPTVWAGSAFKGANGSCQQLCSLPRYVSNQEAWINEMRTASEYVQFAGVVLTGWSRYSHYATICELLPTAMNSLANCLKCYTVDSVENHPELRNENTLPDGQWPGKTILGCVRLFVEMHKEFLKIVCGDLKMTWMNCWQLYNGFLNMFQVDNIENIVEEMSVELKLLEKSSSKELGLIYGRRTCEEWVHTNVGTMEAGFMAVRHSIKDARNFDRRFPHRSLASTSATSEQAGPTPGREPSMDVHVFEE